MESNSRTLKISGKLSRAVNERLAKANVTELLPVQAQTLGGLLDGRDAVIHAPTGSGKTLAYLLPVAEALEKLRAEAKSVDDIDADADLDEEASRSQAAPEPPEASHADGSVVALVVLPTRELAAQVHSVAVHITGAAEDSPTAPQVHLCCGGTDVVAQEQALRGRGLRVVVGTPGRLRDLHTRGHLRLHALRFQVVDEADRLLDEGFLPEVQGLLRAPGGLLQTVLASATAVGAAKGGLARAMAKWLRPPPHFVEVDLVSAGGEVVRQRKGEAAAGTAVGGNVRHLACPAWGIHGSGDRMRMEAVADGVMEALGAHGVAGGAGGAGGAGARAGAGGQALVFVRETGEASDLAGLLAIREAGKDPSDSQGRRARALHGGMAQAERAAAMQAFRDGAFAVLVATDVAARGLDIAGVELVVHCNVPASADMYCHRAGRAGRRGCGTDGVSLLLHTPGEAIQVEAIEREAGVVFTRLAAIGDKPVGIGSAARMGATQAEVTQSRVVEANRAQKAKEIIAVDRFASLTSDLDDIRERQGAGGKKGKKKKK